MLFTVHTAIWIGLLLRLFIAIWNGFFGPSFGAELDALSFHIAAVEYAQNPTLDELRIGWIYTYMLGLIYYLTTDSLFLGSLLSCVAWLASAYILVKIMRLLSIDKSYQFKAMLIYALLPSAFFFTSVTLREPYQLLFVNLVIYSALKIYLNKSSFHWLVLFCAVITMGLLHGALFAFGIFIVLATLVLLTLREGKSFSLIRLALVTPLVFLVALYGLSLFTSYFYNIDGGLSAAVESYQQGLLAVEGRTNYKDSVEISGVTGLLLFIPVSLLQYFFEPMPWRISSASDVVALFENILRTWLIWKVWTGLRNMPTQGRRPVLFVFLSYLVIETIWALGTVNWGTALRHHISATGILLAAAFANRKIKKKALAKEVKK